MLSGLNALLELAKFKFNHFIVSYLLKFKEFLLLKFLLPLKLLSFFKKPPATR